MTRLSVILVNYNNLRVLRDCLPALFQDLGDFEAEVIVSDNGSRDDSLSWVRANYPAVRVLENGANLGFAEGNNRAFAAADGEFVFLLNPDTVVRPGAIQAMLGLLDRNPRAGAVGCRLLNADGTRQVSARSFPTFTTYLFELTGLAWRYRGRPFFARFNMTHWDGSGDRVVDWISGAAIMVRREVIQRVGGLDPYFFLTYDEVDWCRRIRKSGLEVWYTGAGEIVHLDRQSDPQSNPSPETRLKYITVERNSRVRYFVKHHGVPYAAVVEALHVLLCAGFCVKAWLLGTSQPLITRIEKRLMLVLYWQTFGRALRIVGRRLRSILPGSAPIRPMPLFVNPYLGDDA